MKTYDEYCGNDPVWLNNADAKAVFDFLCEPENIYNMIVMSERGLPAISGIVKELEEKFANAPQFPLKEGVNRQNVGKMVKCVLLQFGYEVLANGFDDRAQLRNFTGAKHFKTAAVYAKTAKAEHSLSIQIV